MPIGSGISGQVGGKAESTYGTAVTVDRFWELMSEGIKPNLSIVDVPGIRGARFIRTDRTKRVTKGFQGPIVVPVLSKNMGLLFQHALGQDTITTITGISRKHTVIPDSLAQFGKYLTIQVGKPDIAGTVQPFTYKGCKFTGLELACSVDQALMATFDVDAASGVTGTALATASYVATQEPFIWAEATVKIATVTTFCKGFTLKYQPALAVDRIGLGNLHKEPIANALASVTGTLDLEFESLSEYTNFIAGTQQALDITFASATMIETTNPYRFIIQVPKLNWTDFSPVLSGADIIKVTASFRGEDDGTNPVLTLILDNADTTA